MAARGRHYSVLKGHGFSRAEEFGLNEGLYSLRKKSEKQISRGLKPARDDKNKRLIGTTEVVP